MTLSGHQIGLIQEALLSAFPSEDELRMMVRLELNMNLEAIARGRDLRVVAFNLVSWAEQTGRVDELVQGAYRQNSGNDAMQEMMRTWGADASNRSIEQTKTRLEAAGPASIDIFLSYSRKDTAAARIVQDALHTAGLSVWTDASLDPGTPSWQEAIADAISQARCMVVLLSPNANQSLWVKKEIGFSQAQGKDVLPVLLSGDTADAVPISVIDTQWVDGRENLAEAVTQKLLPALGRYFPALKLSASAPAAAVTTTPISPTTKRRQEPPGADTPKSRLLPWGAIVAIALIVGGVGLFALQRLWFPGQPGFLAPVAPGPSGGTHTATQVLAATVDTETATLAPTALPRPATTPTPVVRPPATPSAIADTQMASAGEQATTPDATATSQGENEDALLAAAALSTAQVATATGGPDARGTSQAMVKAVETAVAATLVALPTDKQEPTPNATGTAAAHQQLVNANAGATLTALAPTVTPTAGAIQPIAETLASGVNIRSGPGSSAQVVDRTVEGQRFPVIGQSEGCTWLQVVLEDGTNTWILGAGNYTRLNVGCSEIPAVFTAIPSVASTPRPAPPTSGAVQPVAETLISGLNIRSGPGSSAQVVGRTVEGQRFPVIGQSEGCTWLQVILKDGTNAWILGAGNYTRLNVDCSEIP